MKSKIIEAIAEAGTAGISTKADAERAFNAVTAAISAVIRRDREASIPGLGKFKIVRSNDREGRNPATGESIHIAARDNLKFKAAKDAI